MDKTFITSANYRHAINGLRGEISAIREWAGKAWDAGLVETINGMAATEYVEAVTHASIRTLFWADATFYRSGTEETIDDREAAGLPDEFDADNLDSSDRERLRDDAETFVREAWPWLVLRAVEPAQAGHDLHLTRNRHGAGFWDGGHGAAGNALTEIAHELGEGVSVDIEVDADDDAVSFTVLGI